MEPEEFLNWLGDELELYLRHRANTGERLLAGQKLANQVAQILEELSPEQFAIANKQFHQAWDNGEIGNFKIPYDERERYDWTADILGTVSGFF